MNEAVQIRSFLHPNDYGAVIDLWERSGPGRILGGRIPWMNLQRRKPGTPIYSFSLSAWEKL
jgi:hypothetical protein